MKEHLGKTHIKIKFFLVVGPLRGAGVKSPEPLREDTHKKVFFLVVGPLRITFSPNSFNLTILKAMKKK